MSADASQVEPNLVLPTNLTVAVPFLGGAGILHGTGPGAMHVVAEV